MENLTCGVLIVLIVAIAIAALAGFLWVLDNRILEGMSIPQRNRIKLILLVSFVVIVIAGGAALAGFLNWLMMGVGAVLAGM